MTRFSRRKLLRTGAAAGVLAATGMPLAAQVRRGGRLRLALGGAHSKDSWDSRTHSDIFMITASVGAVFDALTEVAADGSLKGELAENWEASRDARVWTFNLRRGVVFHDGQRFGADDVIASLMLHKDSASGARPIVESIVEMRKLTDHQLQFTLATGNADFPYLLSDHHLLIYPAGRIQESMRLGIGTGLYAVKRFEPGVRFAGARVAAHYKDGGAGWFDEFEILAINDATARLKALTGGRVDVAGDLDPSALPLVRAHSGTELFEVAGNRHIGFPIQMQAPTFSDPDLRLALKFAIDRHALVDVALGGHGHVGNDSPVGPANPYFNDSMPQTTFDPDRARYHLKRAGGPPHPLPLAVSDSAFPGATLAVAALQDSARLAGIDIVAQATPADGYWDKTWRTAPWRACCWAGRPTEDWMLTAAYTTGAPWNDTGWSSSAFEARLAEARAALDSDRRREIYFDLQDTLRQEGAAIIPAFANFLAAKNRKVAHSVSIGNVHSADNGRIAERWWMA